MSTDKMLTLITSLIPILATLFLAWLNSRNEQTKRRSRMEEAKHRIELIKSMLFPIVLFASILWSILVSSLIFNPLPGMGIESNIPSVNILATIILTVPVILVALLLRWLAVRFDTPPKKDMETI